ncbi:hypothetical protein ACU3L3_07320 [Priestia endophytica]
MVSIWVNKRDLREYRDGYEIVGYSRKIDNEATINLLLPVTQVVDVFENGICHEITVRAN